jgi:DNA polymerase-3 subunit alpha
MRDLLRKMRPDHINDLVALVALYRPGPMDSIPKYIACKRGKEKPEYLHASLEPILNETFGVMTYQEDVMRIARELGGYTMGQADLLRRAMGKKIPAEMAKHREIFIKGASEKGILPSIADQIFEQAAKFAGYGFNKGHAAAYAQVAFQTAYLKANYPVEFLAASMTLDAGSTDRLNIFRQEAQRLGIRVLPPDINRSESVFACDAEKKVIYYALAAVKGVGRQAMDHVVAQREAEGPFRSLADFARRLDSKLVNKRAFESLVRAGAFEGLSANRRQLVESSDAILNDAARNTRERETGQSTLFGDTPAAEELRLAPIEDWLPHERLGEEFGAIGFYLSGHPLDGYESALKRLGAVTYAALQEDRRRSGFRAVLAGTLIRKQERRGRNDQPYGFLSLSDPTGMFEVMMFSEVLVASRPLLEAGKSILLTVVADWVDDELKLRALSVADLDKAAADAGEGLRIYLDDTRSLNAIAGQLRQTGKGLVTLVVPGTAGQEVEIKLRDRQQVTAAIRNAIKSLPGVAAVETL